MALAASSCVGHVSELSLCPSCVGRCMGFAMQCLLAVSEQPVYITGLTWCHVKSCHSAGLMIQAAIVIEDMIRTEYLRNEWWYWSSLSAAVKTSTLSALALRIHSLDSAIVYDKAFHHNQTHDVLENRDSDHPHSQSNVDTLERSRLGRRVNKKRKEADG
ncbi:hypothetical protein Dimus_011259 [Dionaea muscipula]